MTNQPPQPGQPGAPYVYPAPPGFPQQGPTPQPPGGHMGQQHADPASLAAAAADVATGGGSAAASGDAGPTIEEIRAQVTRDVLLPMEEQIQSLMDQFQSEGARRDGEIAWLRSQLAAAQASVSPGGPPVVKYATAIDERAQAAAAASGLPRTHWAPLLALTGALHAAAGDVNKTAQAGDQPDTRGLESTASAIERWVTRTHVRAGGGPVEHFPALLGDLEELGDAVAELAPAVAAVA